MTDLTDDYIIEAREHLDEMETHLLQLEQTPDDTDLLNNIFTDIHTIKGAAQFVGLSKSSELAHRVEDVLDLLRQGALKNTSDMVDLFIGSHDKLALLVNEIEQAREEQADIGDLVAQLNDIIQTHANDGDHDVPADAASNTESDETTIDSNAVETFVVAAEQQLEIINALLAQTPTTETDRQQLNNSITQIGQQAHVLGLEKIPQLTDKLAPALEHDQFDATVVDLLRDSHERLLVLLNELKLFQLEASSIEDLVARITDLAQTAPSDTISDFIAASRQHLTHIEQAVLSLEKDHLNDSLLTDLIQQFKQFEQQASSAAIEPIVTVCQQSYTILNQYIDNQQRVDFDLMELLAEIEAQLSQALLQLEQQAPLDDFFDDLLAQIQSMLHVDIADVNAPMVDLSDDDYVEEYDQELFDIFLQQLKTTLATFIQDDAHASLSDYTMAISRLKSSANYMGYHNLVAFYEQWLERLSVQTDDAAQTALMQTYIDQLLVTFPQIHLETKQKPVQSDVKATTSTDPDHDTVAVEPDLFNQLTQALESSQQADVSETDMHQLFDEMLTESDIIKETELPVAAEPIIDKPKQATPVAKPQSKEEKPEPPVDTNVSTAKALKRSVRVDAHKIDTLMNQVGELIVDRGYFHQLFNELRLLQKDLKENGSVNSRELKQIRAFSFRFAEAIVSFGRTSNDLQEGVMKVRMLPIAQLFDRYPRLVHDLVRHSDKKVQLEVRGEETELDKMIIEEISDPLIHLIRNAVDHGIESPAERQAKGKAETATLLLEAYNESNHIVVEITDDGRGIDPEVIRAKALEKGFYSQDELARMNDKELIHLILLAGFSTAKQVSNTSGRGVGMDVVKKNIEKLNGILEIDSKPNVYTKMRLKIPLTLAIIRALQVRVGDSFFTVPLSNVEETLKVYAKDTSMMEGTKVIHLRGKTMPIIYLSKLFNIRSDDDHAEKFFVVTVNTGIQQIGLIVDELLGQAEVVIKPLVDYLQEQSGFSGATIIGDGKISLILDIYELINMTTNKQVQWHQQQTLQREAEKN